MWGWLKALLCFYWNSLQLAEIIWFYLLGGITSFAGYRNIDNIYWHLLSVLVSSSWVFGADLSKCFLLSLLCYFRGAAGSAEREKTKTPEVV